MNLQQGHDASVGAQAASNADENPGPDITECNSCASKGMESAREDLMADLPVGKAVEDTWNKARGS
eukprot:1287530-Prorocentrum_lima.AAC.1